MITSFLIWSIVLLAQTLVTRHLARDLGILIAHQGLVAAVGATVFIQLARAGEAVILSGVIAVSASTLALVVLFPVVLLFGASATLLATVTVQLLSVPIWLGLPEITGGSGGLFVPPHVGAVAWVSILSFAVLSAALGLTAARRRFTYEWPTFRHAGPRAGILGAPFHSQLFASLALSGAVVGISGVTGAVVEGSFGITSLGISWSLVVLLIALVGTHMGTEGMCAIVVVYAALRVVARNSVGASAAASNILDAAFPLGLFLVWIVLLQRTGDDRLAEERGPSTS